MLFLILVAARPEDETLEMFQDAEGKLRSFEQGDLSRLEEMARASRAKNAPWQPASLAQKGDPFATDPLVADADAQHTFQEAQERIRRRVGSSAEPFSLLEDPLTDAATRAAKENARMDEQWHELGQHPSLKAAFAAVVAKKRATDEQAEKEAAHEHAVEEKEDEVAAKRAERRVAASSFLETPSFAQFEQQLSGSKAQVDAQLKARVAKWKEQVAGQLRNFEAKSAELGRKRQAAFAEIAERHRRPESSLVQGEHAPSEGEVEQAEQESEKSEKQLDQLQEGMQDDLQRMQHAQTQMADEQRQEAEDEVSSETMPQLRIGE